MNKLKMSTGTKLFYTIGKLHFTSCMKLCTTSTTCVYRKNFDTSFGATNPLIDGPDFTFVDGRSTPLTVGQKKRAIAQKEAVETVFRYIGDIDSTIKRFEAKERAAKEETEQIISSKFKEKGEPLDE